MRITRPPFSRLSSSPQVCWLLICALVWGSLVMPLMGGLLSAAAASSADGHWLVVCTSKGYERIRVDPQALEDGLPVAALQFAVGADSREALPTAKPESLLLLGQGESTAHAHCNFCLALGQPDLPVCPLGNPAIQIARVPMLPIGCSHVVPPRQSPDLGQPLLPTPPPVV